jgi:integrase
MPGEPRWSRLEHVVGSHTRKFTLQRSLSVPRSRRVCYFDQQGRRVDFHSLRLTFGTNLVLSGAHPRVVQELMRHSDIRLTMKLYTDVSKLPMREAVAALPSFGWNSFAGASYGPDVKKLKLPVFG